MSKLSKLVAATAFLNLSPMPAWAVEAADPRKGTTLWEMMQSGGFIIWVLIALSAVAGAIIIYCFKILKIENFVPKDFSEKATEKIDAHDFDGLKKLAKGKDHLLARMVDIGLNKRTKGRAAMKEAMELYTHSEVNKLWQLLGYLADIATIAPLLGLLGTVFGIIQAFHAFTQHTVALKLGVLASGVSLALVATAGGLCVAIPVMIFYAYLKPRVQQIVTDVEFISSDVAENILRHN